MLTQRKATVSRPSARFEKLVVTETADEVLLYDTDKHHIHHLNATTAAVWRLCDGKHTVVDLAREAGAELGAEMDEGTVRLALTKLDDAGLLKQPLIDELRMSRMSRRTFMQRAGVAGAIAVPAIVSTSAPAALAAVSGNGACGDPCDLQNSNCRAPCSQCGDCTGPGCGDVCCNPGTYQEDKCRTRTQNQFNCSTLNDPGWDASGWPSTWNDPCHQCYSGTATCNGFAAAPAQSRMAATDEQIASPVLSVSIDPPSGAPGAIVTVSVGGFVNDTVTVTVGGVGVATISTSDDGGGSQQTAAPTDLGDGIWDVVATGASGTIGGATFTAQTPVDTSNHEAEQAEADRIAAEKAAAEQAEADRIAAEKAAAEQAEADRVAAEKAAAGPEGTPES